MNKNISLKNFAVKSLIVVLLLSPSVLVSAEKFQVEVYGGMSFINPKDLNLFSRAEEQYNELYFIQRLSYEGGYFVNDFPEIRKTIPAGLRLRYHVSEKFSFSLALEGFKQKKQISMEGSFGYVADVTENHTKKYDPFLLGLSGYAVMGGVHYLFPIDGRTDIEVGAAGGWAHADFDFSSEWTYTATYLGNSKYLQYTSLDGAVLEGDGSGNGFLAQGMLRLNRMLGRNIGFFVETAYTFCRISSLEGSGREVRIWTSDETSWEGTWAIKKEEIELLWASDDVYVPTNYWSEWTASQRERDFVLDLSGFRLVFGICFRL
ncbi:MAG: hypothetical protein JXB26_16240 [Candidatus Aminicenantes bacterium]|nr:hypothetical protein [Candidatus Aminicenantes bacterium]